MSIYVVVDKDNTVKPVHNLKTGIYLVKNGYADRVVDGYSGMRILVEKEEVKA